MSNIIMIEVTNKYTGRSFIEMASNMGQAKAAAIRIAGQAGFLDFKKDRSRDVHAENKKFTVDIMV